MWDELIESMKKEIKNNKVTNDILEKMVSEGIDEDTALDVMIDAWLCHNRSKGQQEYNRRIMYE